VDSQELPDDPRDWPNDPFALLGVRQGAEDADIKRAYTRLIRRFKPEHSPEQFRRVREAYEACLNFSQWMRSNWRQETASPDVSSPADSVRGRRIEIESSTDTTAAHVPAEPVRDEVEVSWTQAVETDDAATYSRLENLSGTFPDRLDIPLRLYWLAMLNPDREPERTRLHWLAEALKRSRLRGPAVELLRRELDFEPARVGFGAFRGLFDTPARAEDVASVARLRISAAGQARMPHVLADDLARLQDRLAEGDEATWLGLLAVAAEWAAWLRDPDLTRECSLGLGRLRHLELSHSGVFDRIEETRRIVDDADAARLRGVPEEVLDVVRLEWCGAGDAPAADVLRAADAVLDRYDGRPRAFDLVLQNRGPAVLFLFARALDRVRQFLDPDETPYSAELLRGLARRLPADRRDDYSQVRYDLLHLLVEEAVDPLEFATACGEDPDFRFRGVLGPTLANDLSLRVIWLCSQLTGRSGIPQT
jgi:hypothetical protein